MSAPAVLVVTGLVKRFGGLLATDHVDLELRRGEIHALIGPNGAGKTTLIHQLAGALSPDAGTIRILGTDVASACSSGLVGLMPQSTGAWSAPAATQVTANSQSVWAVTVNEVWGDR